MHAVTAHPLCVAHDGRVPTARPPVPGRRAGLRRALRASGHTPDRTGALETACLAWLAGVLVEIAGRAGDARTAKLLADEASATLTALAPVPVRETATVAPLAAPLTPPSTAAFTAPFTAPLTRRELVVLRELQENENVPLRQIADSLHVSLNTVRSQTRSVYRKLGVSSRSQALHRARELHLV
ncbi:response regulator transcription factor [Streptomyces venezuelae]|uniref:helix-turn-helix transcriptional regulator n=1 Tax=Streptomyces venezuelae TaxID=54571 RepID=UPI00364653E5